MADYETDVVLLDIGGQMTPVELRTYMEPRGDTVFLLDSDRPLNHGRPIVVVVDTATRRGFVLLTTDTGDDLDDEEQVRALKYVAPRMAERILPTLPLREDGFDWAKDVVIDPDPGMIDASMESAAGETYEQRSHLCFDDTCREILRIWRSTREGWSGPSGTEKEFTIKDLAASARKRRSYEGIEWRTALAWGEGEGYWYYRAAEEIIPLSGGPPLGRRGYNIRYPAYVINGAKMRELEEMLSKSQLGVMPEIVGEIEIGRDGFAFLDTPVREAVERDCREINVAAKAGAAKSVIVMCGSAIEAVLYARLRDGEESAQKKAGELAEGDIDARLKGNLKNASKKSVKEWQAEVIIHVAKAFGLVTEDTESYAHALRDYRNLIHAGKEDRSPKSISSHTAAIAMQVLNLVIKDVRSGDVAG